MNTPSHAEYRLTATSGEISHVRTVQGGGWHLVLEDVHATGPEARVATVVDAGGDVPVVDAVVQHHVGEDHANAVRRRLLLVLVPGLAVGEFVIKYPSPLNVLNTAYNQNTNNNNSYDVDISYE